MDHWRKHHRRTARDIPWYFGRFLSVISILIQQLTEKYFSGKTESDVVAYMKDQVEGYSLKIIEADNKTDEINGEAIS